mgnify:CR=1 FL=1
MCIRDRNTYLGYFNEVILRNQLNKFDVVFTHYEKKEPLLRAARVCQRHRDGRGRAGRALLCGATTTSITLTTWPSILRRSAQARRDDLRTQGERAVPACAVQSLRRHQGGEGFLRHANTIKEQLLAHIRKQSQ